MAKKIQKCDIICVMDREIGEMHENINFIRKTPKKNNTEGIITIVRKNSDFRVGYESKSKLLTSLIGSGWLLAIIAILVMVFGP